MASVAYLRVSTAGQDLDKNKMEILKLAHEKKLGQVEFVEEKVSGKISWKKRKIADMETHSSASAWTAGFSSGLKILKEKL